MLEIKQKWNGIRLVDDIINAIKIPTGTIFTGECRSIDGVRDGVYLKCACDSILILIPSVSDSINELYIFDIMDLNEDDYFFEYRVLNSSTLEVF